METATASSNTGNDVVATFYTSDDDDDDDDDREGDGEDGGGYWSFTRQPKPSTTDPADHHHRGRSKSIDLQCDLLIDPPAASRSQRSTSICVTDEELLAPKLESSLRGRSSSRLSLPKNVSFADDLGKQLVSVRSYQPSTDDQPRRQRDRATPSAEPLRLELGFRQPWFNQAALRERVERHGVAVETVFVYGRGLLFGGTVLARREASAVADGSDEGRIVFARCTFDDWDSFVDVPATFVSRSTDRSDLFGFDVQSVAHDLRASGIDVDGLEQSDDEERQSDVRVQFAVCCKMRVDDRVWNEFWDNNDGKNFTLIAKR